jgi:hypothetical protein
LYSNIISNTTAFVPGDAHGADEQDGDSGSGAGLYNKGHAVLSRVTVAHNQVGGSYSQFSNGGSGGGIYSVGSLEAYYSAIYDNRAGDMKLNVSSTLRAGHGGGLALFGPTRLENVTISSNRAGDGFLGQGGNGGGFFASVQGSNMVELRFVTVANNQAGEGHFPGQGGGIFNALDPDNVTLYGVLLADNSAWGGSPACNQVFSLGFNLFDTRKNCLINGNKTGNLEAFAKLGVLGDNGGLTWTQALLPGSPAINAALCLPGIIFDQREVVRPQGTACDIGAFELQK